MPLAPNQDADAFTEREFRFTPRDFRHIAGLVYADAGIALSEAKAPLVYSRLVKRLRALGLESFAAYCHLVETDNEGGHAERERMMAALTTNITRFFREPHHFDHLAKEVLPPLVEATRAGRRLRIWSAGCSSGEEPYSIALSILKLMPDAAEFDVKVLATDINPQMLERGRRGLYSEAAIGPVSRQMRVDWFTQVRTETGEKYWQVGPALSQLVAFRPLNLIEPWPMRAQYQAIFCRNVLIYFDHDTRLSVWERMAPLLTADGRLYVGHSERVTGPAGLYALEKTATTYRRTGARA